MDWGLGSVEITVNKISQEVLEQHCELIRGELTKKLRQSRLAAAPAGVKDQEFGRRFGWSLGKVGDADIAALILYLEPEATLGGALGKLYEHIRSAPEGETGLPYFDEWMPMDDDLNGGIPVVWSNEYPDKTRELLADGYRIRQSMPHAGEEPGFFVTMFVKRELL